LDSGAVDLRNAPLAGRVCDDQEVCFRAMAFQLPDNAPAFCQGGREAYDRTGLAFTGDIVSNRRRGIAAAGFPPRGGKGSTCARLILFGRRWRAVTPSRPIHDLLPPRRFAEFFASPKQCLQGPDMTDLRHSTSRQNARPLICRYPPVARYRPVFRSVSTLR